MVGGGAYASGLVFFGVIAGSAAVIMMLALRRLPHLAGAPRLLAGALVFTGCLLAEQMIPGMLGVLSRWSAAACGIALVGCAALVTRRGGDPGRRRERDAAEPVDVVPLVLFGLAAAAIAVYVAGYFRSEATHVALANDMMNFHLPLLAHWIQRESLWPVLQLLPYDSTGNYPQNGDVIMLATVLPWRGDAFARLAVLPYIGLAAVATYALGRELRADRARAALYACLVAAIPIVLVAGVVSGLPDVVMYGTFGAGLVFLVRSVRTRLGSDALLAGLGLGIAFGTKWYAVPATLAVLGLWAVALVVVRRPPRLVVRHVGIAVGALVVSGGFWLVRNAVESGTPFFPAGWLPVGARSDVVRPGARTDFPLVHYLFDGRIWSDAILPDEWRAFGVVGAVLLAGVIASAVWSALLWRRGEGHLGLVAWLLAVVATLTVVYAITPNTASGYEGQPVLIYYSARYLVPAALPAAALCAWAATRAGSWGRLFDVAAAIAVADGLTRVFDLSTGQAVAGVTAVALVALAGLVAIRLARSGGPLRARRLGALAGAVLVGACTVGYVLQERYFDGRLLGADPTIDYFIAHSTGGARVGLMESWSVKQPSPIHAMFGPRLDNRVGYVGDVVKGINTPFRSRARLASAVERGRYEWLEIGRGTTPPQTTQAMRWVTALGYTQVAASQRLVLFRRVEQRP